MKLSLAISKKITPPLLVALFCGVGGHIVSAQENGAPTTALTVAAPDVRPVIPYRGLTYSEAGIRKVREHALTNERARSLANEVFATVAPWLAYSDEEIRALLPDANALLARGQAGDPKTDQAWPSHGRSRNVCSLDRPGTVRSPYTGDIYGNAEEGERYYDEGDGWVRPSDGKHFYFKGIWNAWIISQLHHAVDGLSLAYMLNGEQRLADRALLILDELATLAEERTAKPGTVDGSSYGSENKHFLLYSGNGANSRMLLTVFALDLLGNAKRAAEPSANKPQQTVFEHIHHQYFDILELFYKKTQHTLYNHTTVLFANQLGQGILFGEPEMIREGLDVLMVWLEQTLNRDGQYYENAGGYERVGVNYAATMMLPLSNYDPAKYDNPERFPQPEAYPFNLRIGNDPSWYSAAYLMKYRMMASGRMIAFGDMWEDRLVMPGETRDWDPRLWCSFGRLLYQQTDNEAWKEEISERYWSLPAEVRNEATLSNIYKMGMSQWLEPERPEEPVVEKNSLLQEKSDLLPAKMIALLRSGEKEDHRATFLSGSVNYSHGHDDQLGLILYAKGMNMTGIFGYPRAGSPAHRGWSLKPASHWTMVVNEDLPPPNYPAKNAPPASLQAWVTQEQGLSAQLVEMSNPHLWRDEIAPEMKEYRRLHWMVDVSDAAFYSVDFFRAQGGHTHDYFITGQWLDQARPSEGFAVEGMEPERLPGVWSLAGLNPRYRNADFNVPGRSWGERLESGSKGQIRSLGIPGEAINVDRYWVPEPGNGYGFIYDVKAAQTQSNWSASWDLIDHKNSMRLTFMNNEQQQAIVARNPAMEVDRYHNTVIARREGEAPLQSQFAALIDVAEPGHWSVSEAERLDLDTSQGMGVRLKLKNGSTDTLLAGQSAQSEIETENVRLKGARAFVRRDEKNEVQELLLHEGTRLELGVYRLALAEPNWQAEVLEVFPDAKHNQMLLSKTLPSGQVFSGQAMLFAGTTDPNSEAVPTLQEVAYMVKDVKARNGGHSMLDVGSQRIISSTVVVDEVEADGAILSTWPNEIRGGRFADTGYYSGRKVVAVEDAERSTIVQSYPSRKKFYPLDEGIFHAGEKLAFYMVQPGDRAHIPYVASLKKEVAGEWILSTNADIDLRLPAQAGEVLYAANGDDLEPLATSEGEFVECRVTLDRTDAGKLRLVLGSASETQNKSK